MAEHKSKLAQMLDKFYSNGVLKQVYTSKNATVCNVFDQYYVAFSHAICDRYTDQFPGFIVNSEGLRTIVEDDTYINFHYQSMSEENKNKSLAVVDERLLHHMIAHKTEFASRPPKVDLAYEQQVMAMQGKQGELASMLEEQQAQSLAAAQQKGVPSQK
jgi:hypothetical protein